MFKHYILIIMLVFFVGCSYSKTRPLILQNLNSQFAKELQDSKNTQKLDQIKKTLENITNISIKTTNNTLDSAQYYRDSIASLKKEALELGLEVETIDNSNILIHTDSASTNTLTQNFIFLVDLDTNFLAPLDLAHFNIPMEWKDGIHYGLGSLYPKGFISSLLWAILDFSKTDNAQSKNIQLLVTQGKNSLPILKNKVQKLMPDNNGLLILSGLEYPGIQTMKGQLEFSIDIPQDSDWLIDISTLSNENKTVNIKYNEYQDNKKVEKTQSFGLSLPLNSFIGNLYKPRKNEHLEALTSFFINQMSNPNSKVNLENSKNKTLLSFIQFLHSHLDDNIKLIGQDSKIVEVTHLQLDSMKTESRSIKFIFSGELSGENPELFTSTFQTFIKEKVFLLPNNTNSLYTLNIINYLPSYSIYNQNEMKDYGALLEDAYSHTYHQSLDLKDVKYYPIFSNITPRTLIMGSIFQSPEYYAPINFIPESKLFLDYQFLMYFLSHKIKS